MNDNMHDNTNKNTSALAAPPRSSRRLWVVTAVAAAGGTFGVAALLTNISDRKAEALQVAYRTVDLNETTVDPATWGRDFPHQYDSYKRTVDTERTRYGGSDGFQKLDENPVWRNIWAGYAFAIDFREDRGHSYMLQDQRETERVKQKKQPGACLHCHASVIPAYRAKGLEAGAVGVPTDPLLSPNGQAQLLAGFSEVCKLPYAEATALVSHPVACLDCHDPKTLSLRVSRPAMLEGMAALAASSAPQAHLPSIERWRQGDKKVPYNPNALASRQEMRSLVCGQCHVEYYFAPETKRLTYPWMNGLKVESQEAYYNSIGFSDWTHAVSGAPALKAQHPEFEMWSQGVHAQMGVSCADCHMPYERVGAVKVSSHHVRSPLLNIAGACLNCHPTDENVLLARVQTIQDTTAGLLHRGEAAVSELITRIAQAKSDGVAEVDLDKARALQRGAQFRLDWVSAENSMGFHAPQEAARVLAECIDLARQGTTVIAESARVARDR